jgi:hypothetical protein
MKIQIVFLMLVVVAPIFTHALLITEVMYDLPGSDTGREWIEVWNNGTSSIELARMRLHDGKSGHAITSVHGNAVMLPGTYAIIVRDAIAFEEEYQSASLAIFRSPFSFNNTGATIGVRDATSRILDTITYTKSLGSDGDGNTLNRDSIGVSLVARTPSPGTSMKHTSIVAPVKEKPKPKSKTQPTSRAKNATISSIDFDDTTSDTAIGVAEYASVVSSSSVSAHTASAVSSAPDSKWLLALFALVALSFAAIFSARHFAKREWDIVEESGE